MAPDPRVVSAFRAMKSIGIGEKIVKPVLKKLLTVYDKNWELIEAENYRVLADAIFEDDDSEKGKSFGEEAEANDELEQPLKRQGSRVQEWHASVSPNGCNPAPGGPPFKRPKMDKVVSGSGTNFLERSPDITKSQPDPISPQNHSSHPLQVRHSYGGKEPIVPQVASKEKRHVVESRAVIIRDPVDDRGKQKMTDSYVLIKPKDEPFTDDLPLFEAPIAVICPDSSARCLSPGRRDVQEHSALPFGAEEYSSDSPAASRSEKRENSEVTAIQEKSPANLEIASSSLGEVKISLTCNSMLGRPNFHMPSQDELLKSMQETCLQSYKILDPDFSVLQILKDMCEIFLELGTDSSHESQERLMNARNVDVLKKTAACSPRGNGSVDEHSFPEVSAHQISRQLKSFSEDTHTSTNNLAEIDRGQEVSFNEGIHTSANGSAKIDRGQEVSFSEDIHTSANGSVEIDRGQEVSFGEDVHTSANGSVEIDRGQEVKDTGSHSLVVVPHHHLTSEE